MFPLHLSIPTFTFNCSKSYMHVQNLMNSFWGIRISFGLVPKESPCIFSVKPKHASTISVIITCLNRSTSVYYAQKFTHIKTSYLNRRPSWCLLSSHTHTHTHTHTHDIISKDLICTRKSYIDRVFIKNDKFSALFCWDKIFNSLLVSCCVFCVAWRQGPLVCSFKYSLLDFY